MFEIFKSNINMFLDWLLKYGLIFLQTLGGLETCFDCMLTFQFLFLIFFRKIQAGLRPRIIRYIGIQWHLNMHISPLYTNPVLICPHTCIKVGLWLMVGLFLGKGKVWWINCVLVGLQPNTNIRDIWGRVWMSYRKSIAWR